LKPALSLLLNLALAGLLSAKSETVRMTITGCNLPKVVEVSDRSILSGLNIWIGPGTSINGVPDTRDGFAMWSGGAVVEPSKGLPRCEVSLYGRFPEERAMYVFTYLYDPAAKKGYVYLPGKGEKCYETNVGTIYRGVEGKWFHASGQFDDTIGSLIRKTKAAAELAGVPVR